MLFVNEKLPLCWYRRVLELPWGKLKIYFSYSGIGMLTLPGAPSRMQDEPPYIEEELIWPELEKELLSFFQGREIKGEYPLLSGSYSPWTLKVLGLAVSIPFGQTRSYREIARAAGKPQGARAVGQALRRNRTPVLVPCHRVIRQKGGLGGFNAGQVWKRRLLILEGNKL